MLNYTNYIRRLTTCFNERLTELDAVHDAEEAETCWKLCSGWLAGAELAATCIIDRDLRSELEDMLRDFRATLNSTCNMQMAALGGDQ